MQEVRKKKFFKVHEVAKLFRRHPRTIYRWLTESYLDGIKVKSGWLIPVEEVERLLREAAEYDAA